MRAAATFLVLSLGAPAAAQDVCHEYWFARNLIFDRAGYCFGSPLGKAIFDNADCTTTEPVLSAADLARVAFIREAEAEAECAVDTDATALDFPDAEAYRTMPVFPIRGFGEDGCLGWRGEAAGLFAQPVEGATQIGDVQPGDTIVFGHYPEGAWDYVTVIRYGTGKWVQGWTKGVRNIFDPGMCDGYAG